MSILCLKVVGHTKHPSDTSMDLSSGSLWTQTLGWVRTFTEVTSFREKRGPRKGGLVRQKLHRAFKYRLDSKIKKTVIKNVTA